MGVNREELIYMLNEAAELEHMLCCQYLFAAFSLKQDVAEGVTWEELNHIKDWGQTLLLVAREEMSHLGLVCNLLTSIGGAPHFARPTFPQPPKYYPFEMALRPFGAHALKRFVCIERPAHIAPEDAFCAEDVAALSGDSVVDDLSPYPVPYKTVGELYGKIRQAFAEFPASDQILFIGPAGVQVDSQELLLVYPKNGVITSGLFDVVLTPVVDRPSALLVIDTIVEQGEGGPGPALGEPSHYERFLTTLHDLQRLEQAAAQRGQHFQPTRPVVANPCLYRHPDTHGGYVVTNAAARAAMDVCNAAYETLLLLLTRMYAFTDETEQEFQGLSYIVLPFMIAALRPLCELVTTLPAADGALMRAGPSFEISTALAFLPHKQAAWQLLSERLSNLALRCKQLSQLPGMPQRLETIGDSVSYMANRFKSYLGG